MLYGINVPLQEQIVKLSSILVLSPLITNITNTLATMKLPEYYVVAGCINQTVWNYQSKYALDYGIDDIDIAYWDDDTSYEKEDMIIQQIKTALKDCPKQIDVKNQARVHIWFEDHYGYSVPKYTSLENAISTWPTTSTCIGVRNEQDNITVCAPYGLTDIFSMTIRPNKKTVTSGYYDKKSVKWLRKWPNLTVMPW